MPFLGRADWGGPFNAYYESLSNLGAEYVRYVRPRPCCLRWHALWRGAERRRREQAPWFANPRAVVPELTPSDCTATKPATNWNSSYFDDIMRDFMAAVVRRRCFLDSSAPRH